MSEELKPCPFCGGEAELDTSQAYRALSGGTLGSRAAVYCARCGADMGFCYEDAPGTPREDIVNQVVDDWNRRAPSPGMREAVEDLTAEADGAYIKYIDLVSKPECLGVEAKLQTGRFGSAELNAHLKARELYGVHVGMRKVLAALRSLTGAKP